MISSGVTRARNRQRRVQRSTRRQLAFFIDLLQISFIVCHILSHIMSKHILPHALRVPAIEKLKDKRIVLASNSPRRKEILRTFVRLSCPKSRNLLIGLTKQCNLSGNSHIYAHDRVSHRILCRLHSKRIWLSASLRSRMNTPSQLLRIKLLRCTKG